MEERATAGVLFVVVGEALLDVGQPSADAVLMPLERREVDGVGEVRSQQLVGLGFELGAVGHEVGDFLVTARHVAVERGIDFCGEVSVSLVADRDARVGVRDEAFRDRDRHRTPRAARSL
ncbi:MULTISPECIES: hypothetical protein [Micrococcus]|uniref:Uncharacterized protein n=1 Tax=Micrococcus yunnanensis TaxID=566027 RepID=A0AAP5WE48_9MICC|nr:hypothetical protein [Micrococcus yunnanensis]MDV7177328.1 hypothetical protein [Micrococcus yunnanensis]WHM17379.1 hypothetical protein QL063_04280 [Micrococcus yunnanensis]